MINLFCHCFFFLSLPEVEAFFNSMRYPHHRLAPACIFRFFPPTTFYFPFADSEAKASFASCDFADNVLSTCLLTSAGLGSGLPPLLFLTSSTISSTISSNSTPGSVGTPNVAPCRDSWLSARCKFGRCPRALSLRCSQRLPGERVKAPEMLTPMMA